MKSPEVTRRRMLALVGAAAAAVAAPAVAGAEPRQHLEENLVQDGAPVEPEDASVLVAPLAPGTHLGVWVVTGVGALRHGALTVALSTGDGAQFYLDVCARDNGLRAHAPPARSERFDVFLSNHGNGAEPTVEGQGLAAMALAEIVRANENRVRFAGFLTLRERLQRFPDEVVSGL